MDSPVLSDEIQLMVKTIKFEESRVAIIKKWIKEDGMEKQEAKDRFQKEMDAMVREALGLPDETEQEKEYRLRAKATQEENKLMAAELDADGEE